MGSGVDGWSILLRCWSLVAARGRNNNLGRRHRHVSQAKQLTRIVIHRDSNIRPQPTDGG